MTSRCREIRWVWRWWWHRFRVARIYDPIPVHKNWWLLGEYRKSWTKGWHVEKDETDEKDDAICWFGMWKMPHHFFIFFSLVGKCCSMRGLTVGFSTGRLLSVQKQRVQTTNQIHQMTSSAQTRRPGGVFSRSESLNLGQLGIIQCPKLDPIHSYSMI